MTEDHAAMLCKQHSPSKLCKLLGLKSLVQVSRYTHGEASEQTLINWHREKPHLFVLLVKGAGAEQSADIYREALRVAE